MATRPETIEQWRSFFGAAGADIFQVVEHAILVAALDCPNEFKLRRDKIAEKLFTCHISPRSGRSSSDVHSSKGVAHLETMEEEPMIIGEIMQIKEVISNHEESEEFLLESLGRLQGMMLTVEILKATQIGIAVGALKRHKSKRICVLVRTLIEGWKALANTWFITKSKIKDYSPDSVNLLTVNQKEGLSCPLIDEDHKDNRDCDTKEDNNNGLCNKKQEHSAIRSNNMKLQQQSNSESGMAKEKRLERIQEPVLKQSKPRETVSAPTNVDSGLGRLPSNEQNKSKCSEEVSMNEMIAISKRKLHDSYQQANELKNKKRIKVIGIYALPK